jgi:hypothetical protein
MTGNRFGSDTPVRFNHNLTPLSAARSPAPALWTCAKRVIANGPFGASEWRPLYLRRQMVQVVEKASVAGVAATGHA